MKRVIVIQSKLSLSAIGFVLILPFLASCDDPEDFGFPREPETTKGGDPLPLGGKPITKTPVIVKTQLRLRSDGRHAWLAVGL